MKINFIKLATFFAVLFFIGLLVNWIGFPALLRHVIKNKVVLTPGSETREMWSKVPFPVDFKIYVFNVTNPEEATKGAKPIVQEIGPYMFDEWKDKYNLEDNEADDTVTFNMRNTFIFRPDKSGPLTGEEFLVVPHPLIQPLAVVIKRERAPMLPLISQGLKLLFPTEQPFYGGTFLDIFFRGIPVDCSSDEFAAKAICTQFEIGEVKGGVKHNATHFKFALMAGGNHTDAGKFTVYRGGKKSRDVGRVLLFNDEEEMSVWGDEGDCNNYRGTDSTIFPPLMKKEEGLWAFAADLCISLGAYYERPSSYMGVKTLKYTMDFGDIKNEKHRHCYCNDPPDDCPLRGTMQLNKCVGGPLVISLPHFFDADPALQYDIIGLNPNAEDHKIFLEYEIMTGSPLSAAKRLQFSLDIEPVAEVDAMKNIRKMIMPLFWVEESAHLNSTYIAIFKKFFLTIHINNGLKWSFTVLGCLGFAACMYCHTQKTNPTILTKSQVTDVKASNGGNGTTDKTDVTDIEQDTSTKY